MGIRSTGLSSLRGELFGTAKQPRDRSPNAPERIQEVTPSRDKPMVSKVSAAVATGSS